MAKKSAVARNKRRINASQRLKSARLALKKLILSETTDMEEKDAAVIKLQKRNRDESEIRVRNRCRQCGRPGGTLRKFGMCRIHLREAAMRGDVPGLKKASW